MLGVRRDARETAIADLRRVDVVHAPGDTLVLQRRQRTEPAAAQHPASFLLARLRRGLARCETRSEETHDEEE